MIEFWTSVLALTIFLYVTLDGFDLGVGMLMPLARGETQRRHMLAAIAPVWDGNETWLVLNGTILFAIFPLTYATLLSAFYLPVIFMLGALIFRGVAFEFREKSERSRGFWTGAFIISSYVATFIQGTAVGALAHGLPMAGDRYVGGTFGWFSTFALLSGAGLCIGYALLGAGWLAYKSHPEVRDLSLRLMPWLLFALFLVLALLFGLALTQELPLTRRWVQRPELYVFPLCGVVLCGLLLAAVRARLELTPFLAAVGVFAAAMCTLGVSFYPYMIPFAITTEHAASAPSAQNFMFWGAGAVILPLTLAYTLVIYFVFKGKIDLEERNY
jgi:cytochrome bd ubiquinol oxidase subunit II